MTDDPNEKWRAGYSKSEAKRVKRYRAMKALQSQGVSNAEIGRRFDLTRQRVAQILAGDEPRPVGKTKRWE